jgi:hypothetical protein
MLKIELPGRCTRGAMYAQMTLRAPRPFLVLQLREKHSIVEIIAYRFLKNTPEPTI